MHHKTALFIAFVLFASLFAGCGKEAYYFYNGPGKKPVYLPLSALLDIRNDAPQPIQLSGTIFLKDTLLFMLEQRKGIHVFNIKDSLNTVNLTFFRIPAATDFTINGNVLYADTWKDLVAINISNLLDIKVVSRVKDVINPTLYPPLYNGFFECVDESKGAVIDWEDGTLEDAQCQTL